MRLSAQTVATPYYVQKIRKLVLGIRQQCDLFCMLARLAGPERKKNRCDISNWENTDSTGQEPKQPFRSSGRRKNHNEKDQPLGFVVLDPFFSLRRYTRSGGRERWARVQPQDLPHSAADEVIFRYFPVPLCAL